MQKHQNPSYQKLFESWSLKGRTIKNRICIPALVTFGIGNDEGLVTDKHLEHYEAMAAGGAGLIIQEATAVNRPGRLHNKMLGIWEDNQIESLSKLSSLFHSHSLPAIIQLSHFGLLAAEDYGCPSACTCIVDGKERTGRELSLQEMKEVELAFIESGRRALLAGYDGVEIHACHGYFLSQYMNPRVNTRTDEYNAKDRIMLQRIIEGIRAVTPPDFIIGIRLSSFEPSLSDGKNNAVWAESLGVDYINSYIGCDWAQDLETPENYPFNASIYGAECVKQSVSLPVFACLEIQTGSQADEILIKTGTDMAVIGRGSLVNPAWAKDVKNGQDPGQCQNCSFCQWKIPAPCPGRIRYMESKV